MVGTKEQKKDFYNKYRDEILKARLIKKIRHHIKDPNVLVKIKRSTLERYGLLKDDKVVLPKEYKPPKIVYTEEPENYPEILNVVVKNKPSPTQQYEENNKEVNGLELSNWILTELIKEPINPSRRASEQALRSPKTIKQYANNIKYLFKWQNIPYNENKDLRPWLTNPDFIVSLLDKTELSDESKSKYVNWVLLLLRLFPPLKGTNDKVFDKFNELSRNYKGVAKATRDVKNANTPIYAWNVIQFIIKAYFPKESFEVLLLKLYDILIARGDDFDLTIIEDESKDDGKKNYLLLDRKNKSSKIILQNYKTNVVYGKKIINVPKATTSLIMALHPTNKNEKLFPFTSYSDFILKTFRVPELEEEHINTKYIRHSIISTMVHKLNKSDKDYGKKRQEIADLAMHSIGQQEGTYISPLKDALGKLIKENEEIIQDFNDLIEEDEKEVEGFELVAPYPYTIGQIVKVKFNQGLFKGSVQFAHMVKKEEDDGTLSKNWHILFSDGDQADFDEEEMKKIVDKGNTRSRNKK